MFNAMKLIIGFCLLLVNLCQGDTASRKENRTLQSRVESVEESLDTLWRRLLKSPTMKDTLCHMGMETREIPDSAIRSSSEYDSNHSARLARLDNQVSGNEIGAWCTRPNRDGEWIQVDLGKTKIVAGLVTQGRPAHDHWVRSYKVSCGTSESKLRTITDGCKDKIFIANNDRNSKVANMFPKPMSCRYVRIYPQTWHGHICMRFDLISTVCLDKYD